MKKIDILAFGAHCDDVELACGGFLLKMKELGWTTGIIDLTRGEMNSKATPEIIAEEASKAAKILGVDLRRTLDLGDARIEDTYENRLTVSRIIRELQPNLVLAPYWKDRHNDHRMAGWLVRNSNLYSRLKKLDIPFPPHDPQLFLFYLLHDYSSPTIAIDITRYYSKKIEAIEAYRSQFGQKATKMEVRPIGARDYFFHIEARNQFYGSLINVKYAEAFLVEGPLNAEILSELFHVQSHKTRQVGAKKRKCVTIEGRIREGEVSGKDSR